MLEAAGFTTISVGNGADAVQAVRAYVPDAVTMDISMPGIDGFESIRRIREFSDAVIVIVSGLESEASVVQGYGAGADAYLVKPFMPSELRAVVDRLTTRIAVTSRQPEGALQTDEPARPAPHLPPPQSEFEWGDLKLDPSTWTASVEGRPLSLTPTEFGLLEALVRNAPRVVTFDAMARSVYDRGGVAPEDSTRFRAHIANLRQKMGDDSREPRWIESVRTVGYRLINARGAGPDAQS